MDPSELNSWQVRFELDLLIEKYPDRTGKARVEQYGSYDGEGSCCYYADANGTPITMTNFLSDAEEHRLVVPICIVAEWIDSFHPQFKENDAIRTILIRNRTLRTLTYGESPFPVSVLDLLAKAQDKQDEDNTHWSDITDVL